MALIVLGIGLVIFLAHGLSALFRRTLVPDVLLLMGVGIAMGPGLGIVSPADLGKVGPVVATIALVLILFESGISLDLKAVRESAGTTLGLTLSAFLSASLTIALLGKGLLGLSPLSALYLGTALGGTSAAVVIPMVQALGLSPRTGSVLVLESALTDVLCIVGAFSVLHVMSSGEVEIGRTLGNILSSLFFAVLLGALGGVGWLMVLGRIRDFPNTISSTLAYVLIVYGITEWLGYSGAISALATGITMANFQRVAPRRFSRLAEGIEALNDYDLAFYQEAVFLLKTYFFVFLGLSISFSSFHIARIALTMTGAVYGLRLLLVRLIMRSPAIPIRDRAHAAMLGPKGLAAAVLASLPLQRGFPEGEAIRDTAYMVVLTSILSTSLLIFAHRLPAVASLFSRFLGDRPSRRGS